MSTPGGSEPPNHDISGTEERKIMERFRDFFADKLKFFETEAHHQPPRKILDDTSIDSVVRYIQSGNCKNIITMVGAGISTSAGIPDFRSPESGLYHNLGKFNLPDPQAIFDYQFFMENPKPFFAIAKDLYKDSYKPTPSHYFIKLLNDKGFLLRHYTQNIDTLERIAGLPDEKLVEAHGSFHTSHCVKCRKENNIDWKRYFAEHSDEIPICDNIECDGGVIKPDIVLFREKLPERFHDCSQKDFDDCDLLIIMGSSLEVQPFASLVDRVPAWCPRLLINRELVGCEGRASLLANLTELPGLESLFRLIGGLQCESPDNIRDVAFLGNCDDQVLAIAEKLGWGDDLRQMIKMEHDRLDILAESSYASVVNPTFHPQPSL
ncbi:NAD-dependent protein deacetylase Sirt2-like [Arctopsyche grandis]|uniref:NAD-dependent protein deacetylase Sirt2-like n=1 Tax=Arctopsyche grandis TaxID=121162 RepID=UPI00406D7569